MDISARKQAERIAIQRRHEIREIINDVIDGFVYTSSADYKIAFMNRRLVERAGRNAVGEYCYRVLHGFESPCPFCRNKTVFVAKFSRWEVKSPMDGRWYYSIKKPIFKNGRVVKKRIRYHRHHRPETIGRRTPERKRRPKKIR